MWRRQDESIRCAVPGERRLLCRSCPLLSQGSQQARSSGNAWTHTLVRPPGSPPTEASTLRPVLGRRWAVAQQRGLSMERSHSEWLVSKDRIACKNRLDEREYFFLIV